MTDVITSITGVFASIGNWFAETLTSMSALFYANDELTFIGTLAICSLGIGLIMLVFNKVKDFLQFRA